MSLRRRLVDLNKNPPGQRRSMDKNIVKKNFLRRRKLSLPALLTEPGTRNYDQLSPK